MNANASSQLTALEAPVGLAQQRRSHPVGIVVELLERVALGADEAVAEHVLLVAPDRGDAVAIERQLEPAGGLAQRARAKGGAVAVRERRHQAVRLLFAAVRCANSFHRPHARPVSAPQRERVGDWLIIAGAVALFGSLFLTWSHQFSPAFLAQWGASAQLQGLPHDPTAWQVYSTADVLLALLAVALVVTALAGSRAVRVGVIVACGFAVAFTLRALAAPPTNGANIFDPTSPLGGLRAERADGGRRRSRLPWSASGSPSPACSCRSRLTERPGSAGAASILERCP